MREGVGAADGLFLRNQVVKECCEHKLIVKLLYAPQDFVPEGYLHLETVHLIEFLQEVL